MVLELLPLHKRVHVSRFTDRFRLRRLWPTNLRHVRHKLGVSRSPVEADFVALAGPVTAPAKFFGQEETGRDVHAIAIGMRKLAKAALRTVSQCIGPVRE